MQEKNNAAPDLIMEIIQNRRSVRHFSNDAIDPKKIELLITAGKYAPSGSNSQNQRFLVISDKEELRKIGERRYVWPYKNAKKMRKKFPGGLIEKCAAAIFVFAEAAHTDNRPNGEYYIWEELEGQNASAAIQNILLMATSLKIGSVWISATEGMNGTRLLSGARWQEIFSDYEITSSMKLQGIVLLGNSKSFNSLGYPKGEREHGATFWDTTERRENAFYIITKRDKNQKFESVNLNFISTVQLSFLKSVMRLLKFFIKIVDYLIWRKECRKHLKHSIEKRKKHV